MDAGRFAPALLLLPAALLFVALFCAFAILVRYSVSQGTGVRIEGFTLFQYQQLIGVSYYRRSLENSLVIATWVTALAVLLAYPLSLQLIRSRHRGLMIAALLIPVLLDVVIRSYGWVLLLAPSGPVSRILSMAYANPPTLLFNKAGIIIALLNELLPFMVVPIFISISAIDQGVIEAATILGATRRRIFWTIQVPLSAPGLISGAVLVFALAYSALAVPLLLGGDLVASVAILIKHQMIELLNFPLGSAVAASVGVVMVVALIYIQRTVIRFFFSYFAR
jgi:putative spermidine/putrescine transport system permease protein